MDDQIPTKRKYELKKRAGDVAQTRLRITEAAVALHASVGPARTTMSAIAERAGVQRHTVYRHFPDDAAMLGACSAHFAAANPPPDPAAWRAIDDPDARLARALDDLYGFYERTASMWANVFRDLDLVDAVRPAMAPFFDLLAEGAEILAVGRPARGRRRRMLDAALDHALDFRTWHALAADGRVTRAEAIALMSGLVDAAAPASA